MGTGRRDLLILVVAVAAPATCVYCLPTVRQVLGVQPAPASRFAPPLPADAGPADAGAEPADAGAGPGDAGEPDLPAGEVLARAGVGDRGEVRLEAVEGGYALRLVPAAGETLSLEPIARLEGPERVTLFIGPGCLAASAPDARVAALWTGEVARCATEPRPLGLLRGRPPPGGCPVGRVAPGPWTLALHECGRLAEPAATLTFELPEPAAREPVSGGEPPAE